jgi:dTDP-4-amino-4,6-dideoxygalactose transaminase
MNIPLCRMEKDFSILPIIENIIESGIFVNGPHLQNFEQKTALLFGTNYALAVNSGTSALYSALVALNISRGDEIIVPSFTFFSTISPILALGAKPVFVDINPITYCIDETKISENITSNTKAILPVDLYGTMANMPAIMDIAHNNNLFVIEDACEAHGAEMNGICAGAFGDIGCFSLYPSKNLTVFGQGGLLTTNNPELYDHLKSLRNYGQKSKFDHQYIGFNFNMSEITAAFGELQCDKLQMLNEQRINIAARYKDNLENLSEINLPIIISDKSSVYYLFVIRIPHKSEQNRDLLKQFLAENEIETGIHFPIPCHMQQAYRYLYHDPVDLPITEQYSEEVLSLPMSPFLTSDEVDYVCKMIKNYFNG